MTSRKLSPIFSFFAALVVAAITFSLAVSAQAQTETEIYSFTDHADGALPIGGLISDAVGNLYGATLVGGEACAYSGTAGCGIVYKLAPSSTGWAQTVLYTFSGGSDGAGPGGLVFDAGGNLYGVAAAGGNPGCLQDFGCGLVFRLSPTETGWQETVLYAFKGGDDGSAPLWSLVRDGAGNLYGTTSEAGNLVNCPSQSLGCGTAFKLSPGQTGWSFTLLYSFTDGDSSLSTSPLILDNAGNLYGTGDAAPYGVVYKLSPTSSGAWKNTVLYRFNPQAHGYGPTGLIFDSKGSLYGTTYSGGTNVGIQACQVGCGTVFKLTHGSSGWTEKVLHNFTAMDSGPNGSLILDAAGNLYGADSVDVYKLSRGSNGFWKKTVLHLFTGLTEGLWPEGPLLMDKTGHLYGVTYGGGVDGWGDVFEITP